VGLNYYVTSDRVLDHRLDRYPPSRHGGNGALRYADVEAVRTRRRGLVGHRAHLFEAWWRYRLPVALTEVHLACTREEQARWLAEAWEGARTARADGADVVAVTPWALLGSYDWDSLVTAPRGATTNPARSTSAAANRARRPLCR
jgi:dTDP-4-dehydrorhamnose reductase